MSLIRDSKKRLRIDWNGHPKLRGPGSRKIRAATRWALNNYSVYITSTSDGSHATGSWHYENKAVDLGAQSTAVKARCQRGLYRHFGPGFFHELFGPDNEPWVKDGEKIVGIEGSPLETQHDTHVHLAAG